MLESWQIIFLCHFVSYWLTAMPLVFLDIYWYLKGDNRHKLLNKRNERANPSVTKIMKAIVLSFLNQLLTIPVLIWFMSHINVENLSTIRTLPLMIIYVLATDIWFYFTHRMLHNRFLFKYIHYIHHEWEYPIAVRAMYAHPLEHIIGNVASVMIGPFLFPSSIYVICAWTIVSTVNSVLTHSGTKIPFIDVDKHDLHHRYMIYNYGTFVSDTIFGTRFT